MFTANVTPRLKLMSPLDSDQFESSDYAQTFAIIDSYAGIAKVDSYANLAALSAGTLTGYTGTPWGTAQHGLMALDRHNNALWWYSNPSGTGTWLRANSVGNLKHVAQSANVVTKTTTGTTGALVLTSAPLTVPGQRSIEININFTGDNTSGSNGMGVVTLTDGSSILHTWYMRLGSPVSNNGTQHSIQWYVHNPTPESSHEFRFYVRSATGSASSGGGGTTTIRETYMTVNEI